MNYPLHDRQEFEKVFTKYYRELVVYLCFYLKEQSLAEDIVQDVFYKLWAKREKYRIETNIRTFLFRTARNAALNYLTREKKMTVELSQQLENEIVFQEDMESVERDRKLYALIERLPEQRKRIFKMCFFKGLHYAEVAQKLNISVNTVKTQMGRALAELKDSAEDLILLLLIKKIKKIQ